MARLPNTEQLAKEMAEFCMQVIQSVTSSAHPVLRVAGNALAGSDNEPNKGRGFWFRAQEWEGSEIQA
jgi:hypothetical protein